ncbi:MAG: CHC2 zinc finger domain-containing protein [Microthrixaceae bacterium]|nr:CHC2 zinc finger domain-containing protein [Microthrixaceae bacterium]
MGIVDEDVARVRESTDMVALVSQYSQLRRVGQRWVGLCPFHAEKSPSFSVNAAEGLYHCFGCKASGDAITFIREIEHLDFVDAVENLAARANVTLRYTEAGGGEERKRRFHLHDVIATSGGLVPRAAADRSRRGARTWVPAIARFRQRRGRHLPDRLGSRWLGSTDPSPQAVPT